MKKRNFDFRRRFPAFLFWSWNLIFLAFVIFGFAPTILPEMLKTIREEDLPLIFPITAVILTLIPIVVVLIGFFRLRYAPKLLLALGYGVEGPLMILIAIRFFVFRELNPAMTGLLVAAGIGMVTLIWDLLDLEIDKRGKGWQLLRLIGTSFLLLVGIYAAIWFAFYAVPLVVMIGQGIGDFFRNFASNMGSLGRSFKYAWEDGFQWVLLMLLSMLLGAYTATLLVGLPIAAAIVYIRTWRRALRRYRQLSTPRPTYGIAITLLVVFIGAFALLNRQPQARAFELVRTPPTTHEAATDLVKQENAIRNGLLNAYLSPMRYVSADGNVWHVEDMYRHGVGLSQSRAQQVEQLYGRVARPVMYKPVNEPETTTNRWQNNVMQKDSDEAAELYARFFDEPINEGEKEAIVRAAKATWNVEQAMNQWQMVDDREVHLLKQTLNVEEHEGWAEIELHEAYQNVTWQRQEVLYYFSLPESAVVTGLWLGNSDVKAEAFEHRVAPRGAAQAVYQNEVRRQTDPALLEQLGPTQYRLRIFPIEPVSWSQGEEQEAPPLYLWMNYRVLVSDAGWATPQLAVKRNIFWDAETERSVNGEAIQLPDRWLPASLASTQEPPNWIHQRVNFANGKSVLVSRLDGELPQPELNVAVVVDRSRSMAVHERDVMAAVAQLEGRAASIELFLTAGEYHSDVPRMGSVDEVDDILFFGGMNSADLLNQFASLAGDTPYDAVFVLTDNSGYELGEPENAAPAINAPVWMIHFGGYPIGYDDGTLQVIQASGGGAVLSVSDALVRMSGGEFDRSMSDIVDGYRWLVMDSAEVDKMSAVEQNPDLAPFAARRLILSEMVRQRANLDQLESLDQLHAIAVENSIVTPYSSMLVLVNERQHRLLDELENADDRFEREFEEINDTMGIQVTGVPEPHEYLLMALAVGMLFWYWRQKNVQAVGD